MAEKKKSAQAERQKSEGRREKIEFPREARSPRAAYSPLEPTSEAEIQRRRERAGALRLKNRSRSVK